MTVDHRMLDPRPKLVFTVVVSLLAVVIPKIASLAGLAVVVTGTVALGRGLSLRTWLATLAPFKVLIPLILVLNSFFYGGGEVLWAVPVVPVLLTTGGIYASIIIAARLLVIASVAAWFAGTTDAEDFEAALASIGVPWGFAFLLSLTLRLVPEMRQRFQTIEEAQLSRGLEMEGGPLARARARIPMLIPFLVSVVEYGYELTEALEVRDFGRSRVRTSIVQLGHGRADYLLYLWSVALFAAFAWVFLV